MGLLCEMFEVLFQTFPLFLKRIKIPVMHFILPCLFLAFQLSLFPIRKQAGIIASICLPPFKKYLFRGR